VQVNVCKSSLTKALPIEMRENVVKFIKDYALKEVFDVRWLSFLTAVS